jgi:hypothetical protein
VEEIHRLEASNMEIMWHERRNIRIDVNIENRNDLLPLITN